MNVTQPVNRVQHGHGHLFSNVLLCMFGHGHLLPPLPSVWDDERHDNTLPTILFTTGGHHV